MTAYVLFGLCIFAFVLVGVISMVGAKDTSADLMKERRDRLEQRKSSGTVTDLGNGPSSAPDREHSRAA